DLAAPAAAGGAAARAHARRGGAVGRAAGAVAVAVVPPPLPAPQGGCCRRLGPPPAVRQRHLRPGAGSRGPLHLHHRREHPEPEPATLGRALVRHRRDRPRPAHAHPVRRPGVAHPGVVGGLAVHHARHPDRRGRWVQGRHDRPAPDALHRPVAGDPEHRRPRPGPEEVRGTAPHHHLDPLLPPLAVDRPCSARPVPVAQGEGVRRGGQGLRRIEPADHAPPHAPEHRGPDPGERHAGGRHGHRHRVDPVIPVVRHQATRRVVGDHALRRQDGGRQRERLPHLLPGAGAPAHRPGRQLPGRRPAGRVRPSEPEAL
ncbi:MAG: ABC transporter, permease protein 2 (cluster 5, nickel/peptides/opines), partial [uncultured Acidimicrobiales bacterium]